MRISHAGKKAIVHWPAKIHEIGQKEPDRNISIVNSLNLLLG
jgi:hypothetical protein